MLPAVGQLQASCVGRASASQTRSVGKPLVRCTRSKTAGRQLDPFACAGCHRAARPEAPDQQKLYAILQRFAAGCRPQLPPWGAPLLVNGRSCKPLSVGPLASRSLHPEVAGPPAPRRRGPQSPVACAGVQATPAQSPGPARARLQSRSLHCSWRSRPLQSACQERGPQRRGRLAAASKCPGAPNLASAANHGLLPVQG